jgi:hypothetical protein
MSVDEVAHCRHSLAACAGTQDPLTSSGRRRGRIVLGVLPITDPFKSALASESLQSPSDAIDAPSERVDSFETQSRAMRASRTKPGADDVAELKPRGCLVCRETFLSAWSGERICRRCKSTSGWRNGALK